MGQMARLLVITAVTASLALAGCGSGSASSTTTTTDQTAVHWSRCPNSGYGVSVAGISCRARG
jgi:hypothetical protein